MTLSSKSHGCGIEGKRRKEASPPLSSSREEQGLRHRTPSLFLPLVSLLFPLSLLAHSLTDGSTRLPRRQNHKGRGDPAYAPAEIPPKTRTGRCGAAELWYELTAVVCIPEPLSPKSGANPPPAEKADLTLGERSRQNRAGVCELIYVWVCFSHNSTWNRGCGEIPADQEGRPPRAPVVLAAGRARAGPAAGHLGRGWGATLLCTDPSPDPSPGCVFR